VDGRRLGRGGGNHGDHDHRPAVGARRLQYRRLQLLPFGQRAVSRAAYSGHEDLGTGPLGTLIWLILAGWWLALGHLLFALGLAVTIIGLPFAWAPLKLAVLALWPIRKMIVPIEEAQHGRYGRYAL
jgi:uncharacterized membrane protein YccF (DUF307 family)